MATGGSRPSSSRRMRAERGDPAQRIRRPTAAMQGDGQLMPGPLPQRMLRHERLQIGHDRAVVAERQSGRQHLLPGNGAHLLEPQHIGAAPSSRSENSAYGAPGEAVERTLDTTSTAVAGSSGRSSSVTLGLEPPHIDSRRVDLQRVSARPSDDASTQDGAVCAAGRCCDCSTAPGSAGRSWPHTSSVQPVSRHDNAVRRHQHRQDLAWLRPADRHHLRTAPKLHVAQHANVDWGGHLASLANALAAHLQRVGGHCGPLASGLEGRRCTIAATTTVTMSV